jgi:5-formyltetrahydrofolate cyclo-ligase
MSAQKAALRMDLRARRRALGALGRAQHSARAAKAIARLPQFHAGCRVALYLPFDHEADTGALIRAARRRSVHVYVPVVSDRRHCRLRFYPLVAGIRRGVFGIPVPSRTTRPVAPRWLDLIVVPLVGVDAQGRRLGMGLGFYDRALAFRKRRSRWNGPRLVGLGFDCQRVASVYADVWDLRLDMLATESGLQHF